MINQLVWLAVTVLLNCLAVNTAEDNCVTVIQAFADSDYKLNNHDASPLCNHQTWIYKFTGKTFYWNINYCRIYRPSGSTNRLVISTNTTDGFYHSWTWTGTPCHDDNYIAYDSKQFTEVEDSVVIEYYHEDFWRTWMWVIIGVSAWLIVLPVIICICAVCCCGCCAGAVSHTSRPPAGTFVYQVPPLAYAPHQGHYGQYDRPRDLSISSSVF